MRDIPEREIQVINNCSLLSLLSSLFFFFFQEILVLAGKLWVNNMTSVESKVEQVLVNGKEEERKGARGCRQKGNPRGWLVRGRGLRVRVRRVYNRADAVVP
ncbi:hypothetical protein ALC62_01174 [Cyphomyrmex costatus]|uniref:Uncharacterized protein n=1 Tax=Cyphomyrmex costatus TaxID=456900 RepID=A0A151IPE0_9HYME|nr:hypothetical protein ALC62_01174 [Cyphomyrmex costatus]